jgi:hypothetical protein
MIELDQLRKNVHIKVNDLRSIDLLINGDQFEELWEIFTEDQKLLVINAVDWTNKLAITVLIKQVKSQELASMNMIQLRALGKKRGLIGFMQMSKSTLLSELSKLEGLDYD